MLERIPKMLDVIRLCLREKIPEEQRLEQIHDDHPEGVRKLVLKNSFGREVDRQVVVTEPHPEEHVGVVERPGPVLHPDILRIGLEVDVESAIDYDAETNGPNRVIQTEWRDHADNVGLT